MSALLGVLSFGFFRLNRFFLRGVQQLNARATAKKSPEWRILIGELLRRPLALPIVMTTAPRWNPHAVIASAGPFAVKNELRLDARTADSSAQAWTAVVNSFRDSKPVATLSSGSTGHVEPPAGLYTVVLRYYDCTAKPLLPAIAVDGKDAVPSVDIPPAVNDFYKDLKQRNSLYYLWLNYYVTVMLRHEKRLSADFIRRQYLPAGNPETEFFYGPLTEGERLDLRPHHRLLRDSRVYATIYNRASFPLFWRQIDAALPSLDPVEGAAFYLIRAVRV